MAAAQECSSRVHKSSRISMEPRRRRSQNICEWHGEERRPRARGSTSVWDNWGSNKKITPGPQFRNPSLPQHTDQSQIVRIFCAHVPLTKLSLGKYFRYQKILDPAQEVLSDPGNVVNVFQALPRCRWSMVKQKNKQTNGDDLDFSTT